MEIPPEALTSELAAMENIRVEPSNSKSVLASMNQFVLHLKSYVGSNFDWAWADALEDILSDTPMRAPNYQYPMEVATALLNSRDGRPN
jgi:hypothetical protein